MQQRGEAHRVPAGEVVAERLGQQRAHRAGVLAEPGCAVRLQGGHRVEHLERVAVDVEVVEDVLLDAAQRGQLGQHDGDDAERPRPAAAPRRALGADDALELGEHALGRHAGQPGRLPAHLARVSGVELEAELDARRAARSVRSGSSASAAARDHPQPPRLEVGPAAVGVDQLAAGERLGHRVDREVAGGEVGREVAVAQRHEVDVPAASRGRRRATPPKASESSNAVPRRARARSRGRRVRVARDARRRSRPSARPSRRSRTAPPTSHAVSPASAARAASSGVGHGPWTARHARRDAARDLVVDRAEPPRPLLGEDPLTALGADQDRLGAARDGRVAEVHGDVVHRDGADERHATPADEHVGVVGERAPDAVAVADRQRPDPASGARRRTAGRSPRSGPARRP